MLTCTYVHHCIDLYVRTWLHVELNKHVIVGGWFNTFIFLISVNDSMEISVHKNGTLKGSEEPVIIVYNRCP